MTPTWLRHPFPSPRIRIWPDLRICRAATDLPGGMTLEARDGQAWESVWGRTRSVRGRWAGWTSRQVEPPRRRCVEGEAGGWGPSIRHARQQMDHVMLLLRQSQVVLLFWGELLLLEVQQGVC